jgi:membrane protein DedA with SNARE-associated domain
MATIIEFLIIFATSFGFNLIPFAGPSNLLIASTAAIGLIGADAGTLMLVGVAVALASALAKGVHYMITFFVSGHLSQKRQEKLNADARIVKRWAFPLLYLVAATPLPDEPVVIPLGLMKYNPGKFFSAYFLGKYTIAVLGVFIGREASQFLEGWLTPDQMFVSSIVISVVLTVAITYLLLKVDLQKLAQKHMHLKLAQTQEKPNKPSQEPHDEDKNAN